MNSDPQTPQIPGVTRRRAVGAAGAAGAALLLSRVSGPDKRLLSIPLAEEAQAAAGSCVLIPAKSEGPYFVDEKLNRSDIRTDPGDGTTAAGVPLNLTMVVVGADSSCAPVQGAVVDIWHANAAGTYSDIAGEGTSGKKFLRGLQATDANGQASFTTAFPGWYSGRAVHIHFKVRVFSGSTTTFESNSQLFFEPATTNAIYATSAYSSRGTPNVGNLADNIYGSDGSVKVRARLSRNGTTIATKTVAGVTSGVRALDLVVPKATGGGGARLTMTYTDGAGLKKIVRKTVRIPKKRLT